MSHSSARSRARRRGRHRRDRRRRDLLHACDAGARCAEPALGPRALVARGRRVRRGRARLRRPQRPVAARRRIVRLSAPGVRRQARGGAVVSLRVAPAPRVQPGAMAVVAVVLVDNVMYLTGAASPAASERRRLRAIALFTAANMLGLRTGGRIQVGMAAFKLGALALVVLVGIVWGRGAHPRGAPRRRAGGLVVLAALRNRPGPLHVRRRVPRDVRGWLRARSRAESPAASSGASRLCSWRTSA